MSPVRIVSTLLVLMICGSGFVSAADSTPDERRALIARDVCAGFAANFLNAPGGNISFSSGRFRVEGGQGSITVFEGAVRITEIPGFTYGTYENCLDRMISGFERTRKMEESKQIVEAFNAAFELNALLSAGMCLRSAAIGGFYLGNVDEGGVPYTEQFLRNFLASVSKSVERRLERLSRNRHELGLTGALKFYRFYPDRPVPYFEQDLVVDRNSTLRDSVSADLEDYITMGVLAGRMSVNFQMMVGLSGLLDSARGRFDDRSMRANTHFPPSLACLERSYRADQRRLRQIANDLNITNVSAPEPTLVLPRGMQPNEFFDISVTSKIRRSLKNTN